MDRRQIANHLWVREVLLRERVAVLIWETMAATMSTMAKGTMEVMMSMERKI